MTTTNELIQQALGIPVQKSPVYTAKYLLKVIYKHKPAIIRDTFEDLRDLPFGGSARPIILRRDLEPWMIGKYVHQYDKNSAYLSACRATNLGIGEPAHVAHGDDGTHIVPGLPGIYRVSVTVKPEEVYPVVKDGQDWITNDILIYAQQKGYQFHIHEAYVFGNYRKILDEWAKRIWDAMQSVKDVDEEAYGYLKKVAKQGLGSFASRKETYSGLEMIHPSWYWDVLGRARVHILANIEKYAQEAGYPILVKTDGLYYVSRDANWRTAVPGILDRIGQSGGYKHKFSIQLTKEVYDKCEGVGPGDMANIFKEVAGVQV